MILQNVLRLLGRDENPGTVILGQDGQRLRITSTARIDQAAWDGRICTFRVVFPEGEQGWVALYNVARPQGVSLAGQPLSATEDPLRVWGSCWAYDDGAACLTLRVAANGASPVRIEGAAWRAVERLPQFAQRIAFEFEGSTDGWVPLQHLADMKPHQGALQGRITGPDPFLGRFLLSVRGDEAPVIRLRLSVSGGQTGQLYWSTELAPGFSEERTLVFPLQADGQFHDYVLRPGEDPGWAGQVITALRLDPGNGASNAIFALDYLRGETRAP